MANPKSNTNATSSAMLPVDLRPLHVAHSPLVGAAADDPNALFAEKVADASHGARVLAEIMRRQINNMDSVIQGGGRRGLCSR